MTTSKVQIQLHVIYCELILTHEVPKRAFLLLFSCLCLCGCPVETSLSVLVDTKALLTCPPVLWPSVLVVTWEIVLRDKPPCFRAYRRDTNQTKRRNCTDKRITWASRPDENPALQVDPVAITHDGNYTCQIVTSDANFHHEYHLQVLVPPELTLVQTEKGATVCKAAAGKPAAQISWTREGDCVTEQEPYWGNGTVTVQSTCHWRGAHVIAVSCSVSHLTGNKSLFIELDKGVRTLGFPGSDFVIILYVKFSLLLVILVFVGFLYFQRTNDCRSRK
ncbi:cell surface glycoprotein CD200 receptor 1-like [Moschus berezovskii]|uniref:cell surface glycoprotein CD200 receptor 1-like n=1 Tax=Moschus berezovskii TaxID=68408 RepID=UPI002444F9F0|nr:cell surface glycoprotein CD200 receptor 1-like [Moschus berezovskii]